MLAAFAIVAAAQLVVPASLIVRQERTLREGQVFKFKTAPVDPYDAFRGRYVALRFEQNSAPVAAGERFERGQRGYATVETGPDGFARFAAIGRTPPAGKPYLRVHALWSSGADVTLELPLDRYYMEEHLAPAAERAYWQNNRRGQTNQNAYAMVRIRNGTGVIENLYVAGKPIVELARELSVKAQ
jgi:uncharacterized membrane-anchored protein